MTQITEPPVIPNLTSPTPHRLDPEPFSERMDRTLQEIPPAVEGMNLAVGWIHDAARHVQKASQTAEQSAEVAVSNAHFRGKWEGLTGECTVPASVYHLGSYWQLLKDVSDIAQHEPSFSHDEVWAPVSGGRRFDIAQMHANALSF